jgi:hypothetical protein
MRSIQAVLGMTTEITVLICAVAIGKARMSCVPGHNLLPTLED